MDGIKIEVTGNIAKVTNKPKRITSGTVGLPVEFTFDNHWDGLRKMALFRSGKNCVPVNDVVAETVVPWEVLVTPGMRLEIGVYGVKEDGLVAIPTIWSPVGNIYPGANPNGIPSVAPTAPVWMELGNDIERIDNKIAGITDNQARQDERLNSVDKSIDKIENDLANLGVLVVVLKEHKTIATYSAEEIFHHFRKGGNVLLSCNSAYIPLSHAFEEYADFEVYAPTSGAKTVYRIYDDSTVEVFEKTIAATEYVDEVVKEAEKRMVETLAPTFSESGAVVTCEPVEGYPLGVVSRIEPVQEGSGDPHPAGWGEIEGIGIYSVGIQEADTGVLESGKTYRLVVNAANAAGERVKLSEDCEVIVNDGLGFPYLGVTVGDYYLEFTMKGDYGVSCRLNYEGTVDELSMFDENGISGDRTLKEGAFTLQEYDPGNVRPISGHSAVKLTRNGEAFTLDLGQTVYGGSLDWQTGVLTVDKRCDVFDGVNKKFTSIAQYTNGNIYAYATIDPSRWLEKEMRCSHLRISQTREYGYGYIGVGGESMFAFIQPFADVAAANAWLVEQANNGTPFTMVFVRAEPLTIQLTPREILALSGTNTLHSDTGDTEVTGRADPTAVLEKLTNAIIALGGNI